jgi:hypothetical protein
MFSSKELHDGEIVYEGYNRFPLFPFLLTGLITHPFKDQPALQVYIARQLMNVFFILAVIVVFRLVNELAKNKYLALSVALITFSSYYLLTYNNMIFNDIPALLGFVVALHCAAAAQKTKLKKTHILFYSLFPISLGWQPYAVFITWFLVDVMEVFFEKDISIRMKVKNFIRKPSFIITGLAVTWGVFILGLQLLNEWRIIGGSFVDLPSVNSLFWRSGLSSAEGYTSFPWIFNWGNYLAGQSKAIVLMIIPFGSIFQVDPGFNASIFIVISLIIYTTLKYLKDTSTINKMNLIMIFSGFLWTIPMRHFVALHEFQSIFYIGFVISVYLALLSHINLQAWNLFAINITLAFLIAVSLSNHYKTPYKSIITTQFQNIYEQLPANSKIYIEEDRKLMTRYSRYAVEFFLTGCLFTQPEEAEYIISKNPDFDGEKLTLNPDFNLFKVVK